MPASQLHITSDTPLGANLAPGGATFRAWAPAALEVYVVRGSPGGLPSSYAKNPGDLLVKDANGYWAGYVPGIVDGDLYRFYIVGALGLSAFLVCFLLAVSKTTAWSTSTLCVIRARVAFLASCFEPTKAL